MAKIYLFDANAIRQLSYEEIIGKKRDDISIRTIADVAYEVNSKSKMTDLYVDKLDKKAYRKISEIMNGHQIVRNVVDYYNNKGTGDVGLLAYALTINEDTFFDDEIYIITNDNGLTRACDELGIKTLSTDDYKFH